MGKSMPKQETMITQSKRRTYIIYCIYFQLFLMLVVVLRSYSYSRASKSDPLDSVDHLSLNDSKIGNSMEVNLDVKNGLKFGNSIETKHGTTSYTTTITTTTTTTTTTLDLVDRIKQLERKRMGMSCYLVIREPY